MYVRISAVDCVDAKILKSNPPSFFVGANGRVASSGWSNPTLSPWFYVTPPEDGVQGFDFIALPPEAGSIVRPVLTPVSGEIILPNVDLANYWGSGQPLKGVRVHAVTNTKTANLTSGANDVVAEPALKARSGYAPHPNEPPSFRSDIGPLFRERDIEAMQGISGFHLGTLEDVRAHASAILQRLEDGSMPCDGPWPRADVARFRAWVEGGMPA